MADLVLLQIADMLFEAVKSLLLKDTKGALAELDRAYKAITDMQRRELARKTKK